MATAAPAMPVALRKLRREGVPKFMPKQWRDFFRQSRAQKLRWGDLSPRADVSPALAAAEGNEAHSNQREVDPSFRRASSQGPPANTNRPAPDRFPLLLNRGGQGEESSLTTFTTSRALAAIAVSVDRGVEGRERGGRSQKIGKGKRTPPRPIPRPTQSRDRAGNHPPDRRHPRRRHRHTRPDRP